VSGWNLDSSTLESDRSQHDRTAVCVIVQLYSSATFVSLYSSATFVSLYSSATFVSLYSSATFVSLYSSATFVSLYSSATFVSLSSHSRKEKFVAHVFSLVYFTGKKLIKYEIT
jgi:hypothetical protein